LITRRPIWFWVFVLFLGSAANISIAHAQPERHLGISLISFLLPRGIGNGLELREYIAGDSFLILKESLTDRELMDEIYQTSLTLCHGNAEEALLAAAYGTFEHQNIPLNLGLFHIKIPLTLEANERFQKRVANLPHHIYDREHNDPDKLQHFFSSAWLKQALGMTWLVNLAGLLVETGEDLFVTGGANDPRDVHANKDGITFGTIADDITKVPSSTLTNELPSER